LCALAHVYVSRNEAALVRRRYRTMESLMTPGSQLNRLINSLGLPDRLGNMIGAALDRKIADNAGIASNLFDAFSPLSSSSLSSNALVPFGFVGRPYQSYLRHCADYQKFYHPSLNVPFSLASVNDHVQSLLGRMTRDDVSAAIYNIAGALQNSGIGAQGFCNPNLPLDQQLGQLLQGFLGPLQNSIQNKLNAMNPAMNAQVPMMKKKKKKKGLGGKLKKIGKGFKKGFKKIGKMAKGITKVGKGLFKGVLKGIKGIFKGGLLQGLTGIFQLGGGLLGGLAGGPIGSNMISKIGGKKGAKFFQIFGQMNKMFGVLGNLQNGMNQFNLQNLSKMIRI
ncbi:MAG TPA: hypothetical protein VLH08_22215, partial [Acidobacteriota bacterium]|nr:hypothetical protein [Acidobacteriota bacterium]